VTETGGRLRRSLSKWASAHDQHVRDLSRQSADAGCVRIGEAPDRKPVRLRGALHTVSLRPRGGVPALEAELDDGSGRITLIFLGRRRMTGIDPGRNMDVEGRIGLQDGRRVMFNPRYELRP